MAAPLSRFRGLPRAFEVLISQEITRAAGSSFYVQRIVPIYGEIYGKICGKIRGNLYRSHGEGFNYFNELNIIARDWIRGKISFILHVPCIVRDACMLGSRV